MKIGLALGSGSARGWAHFGVIRELQAMGVRIDVVAGTSVGGLVGAALASGRIEAMEAWVRQLGWTDVVRLMDVSLRGGALQGDRVIDYCAEHFFADRFEDLQLPFGCVATVLATGRELWLREGKLAPALHASMALPGMFSPQWLQGHWLVDGGLVNPVPVSLCRALGADVVIAVELGAGRATRHIKAHQEKALDASLRVEASSDSKVEHLAKRDTEPGLTETIKSRMLEWIGATSLLEWIDTKDRSADIPPLGVVLATSVNIMQARIAQHRLAGDPPEVLLRPRLSDFSILDFHRAEVAIEEGRAAVRRMRAQIEDALSE